MTAKVVKWVSSSAVRSLSRVVALVLFTREEQQVQKSELMMTTRNRRKKKKGRNPKVFCKSGKLTRKNANFVLLEFERSKERKSLVKNAIAVVVVVCYMQV